MSNYPPPGGYGYPPQGSPYAQPGAYPPGPTEYPPRGVSYQPPMGYPPAVGSPYPPQGQWAPSPLPAFPPGPINIRVGGGTTHGRVFLSCTSTGDKVDLYTHDDNSGRQRWIISPAIYHGSTPCHNIFIAGGVNGERRFLSVTGDGVKVDLWTQDDGSGRQRWIIEQQGGFVHILSAGGVHPPQRRFLSVPSEGTKCDLYDHDDGSGHQRWLLSGAMSQ